MNTVMDDVEYQAYREKQREIVAMVNRAPVVAWDQMEQGTCFFNDVWVPFIVVSVSAKRTKIMVRAFHPATFAMQGEPERLVRFNERYGYAGRARYSSEQGGKEYVYRLLTDEIRQFSMEHARAKEQGNG